MYSYAVDNGFIKEEEEYLMRLGDRQDLRINMTKMKDAEFEKLVSEGLARCNKELKVGLKLDELIKTQFFRVSGEDGEDGEDE